MEDDARVRAAACGLLDRFGDNGIIAIVIGRLQATMRDLVIDTWLMSCRVLGRQVEPTTLNLVAAQAQRARRASGSSAITSRRPRTAWCAITTRNLGFTACADGPEPDGAVRHSLDLAGFVPRIPSSRSPRAMHDRSRNLRGADDDLPRRVPARRIVAVAGAAAPGRCPTGTPSSRSRSSWRSKSQFDIKFGTREMDGLNNVGDLVRLIVGKMG